MAAIIVKAKPGESTDKLIKRFQRATSQDVKGFKERKAFISKTEERLLAEKEKRRKIAKLKRLQELGIEQ
ncbi:30S ribosomal protein S21 [Candidatus Daviesbacteria bacterium]|nr:30S ribosomal protein S21 [Candidatus Daviesbacteria bacterium]